MLAISLPAPACGARSGSDGKGSHADGEGSSSATAESSNVSDGSVDADGSADVDTSGAQEAGDDGDFIGPPDPDSCDGQPNCDIFDPEACDPGLKCIATSCCSGGDMTDGHGPRCTTVYDKNLCTPVDGDAQVGEPCDFTDIPWWRTDTCAKGLICHAVTNGLDNPESDPICHHPCTGSFESPECPGDEICLMVFGHQGGICVPSCDPLSPECLEGQRCTDVQNVPGFGCAPLDPTGPLHAEGCEVSWRCDEGHACVGADQFPDGSCVDDSCCSALCRVDEPNACPTPGQVCVPLWDLDDPDSPWIEYGVCGVAG